MDEILASIRKIIADDDQAPVQQEQPEAVEAPAAAAPQEAGMDPEGEQPSLVDDIANALNQEPAAVEEDIFDLTNEISQDVPVVPEAPADAALATSAEPEMPPLPEPSDTVAAAIESPLPVSPAMPDPSAQPAVAQPDEFAAQTLAESAEMPQLEPVPASPDILSGTPMQEAALPDSATGFGDDAPPSGLDLAAVVSDLSADGQTGEIPAPAQEGSADIENFGADTLQEAGETGLPQMPLAASEDASLDAGVFAPEVVEAELAPDAGAFAPEAVEAELAPDAGAFAPEAAEVEPVLGAGMPTDEENFEEVAPIVPEDTDFGAGAAESDLTAAQEIAVPAASGEGKTLEDSVKEMLKPMLREWLDDNMQRIVEDAVQDEIKARHNQF